MSRKKQTVKIVVATHKQYRMPSDPMYLPLQVGAEGKGDLGYEKDNTGIHISERNPSFCELTGLYWAWKNIDADYIGIVHYRRHFSMKRRRKDPFGSVLTRQQLQTCLSDVRVFVPKKRKYYIETLYSHYAHTHYASHLDETRKILQEKYPEYLEAYDRVVRQRKGYMFNMMIMQKELLDAYCFWLFDLLFALEERIDMPELSGFQGRYYGRISEIIFNVWLDFQVRAGKIKKGEIKELPLIHMEKINWGKKGRAFLGAKFMGKKYEGSF